MADLFIMIKKSAETSTLRGFYNSSNDVVVAKVLNANSTAALAELASIGADYSIYDDTMQSESGQQDGIKLPKNAFPA